MLAGRGMPVTKVLAAATKDSPAKTVEIFVRPLLASVVADTMMRCHITMSFGPAACFPGFWCMCVRKLYGKVVGGYLEAVEQPFLGGAKKHACDPALILDNKQHRDMGAEAQSITDALAISTAKGQGEFRPET